MPTLRSATLKWLVVSNDIGNALIQYAAQNGLTMILDISKLLPAVLTVNPAMDVTQAFIADYNSKHRNTSCRLNRIDRGGKCSFRACLPSRLSRSRCGRNSAQGCGTRFASSA